MIINYTDKVNLHAIEVLTLGLLWITSITIREGGLVEGKFNLLAYKAAQWSIEALNLILQVNHVLSPRETNKQTLI